MRPRRQPAVAAHIRRLGAALALLVPMGLPVARAAETATSTPTRVVRIKVVADEAFRENEDWEKEIREHVAWSDEKLRELAGIGLEVVSVEPWTTHGSPAMSLLLIELRAGVREGRGRGGDRLHRPPAAGDDDVPARGAGPLPPALHRRDRLSPRRPGRRPAHRLEEAHPPHPHPRGRPPLRGPPRGREEHPARPTPTGRASAWTPSTGGSWPSPATATSTGTSGTSRPTQLAALVELYREAPLRRRATPTPPSGSPTSTSMAGEVDEALEEFRRALESPRRRAGTSSATRSSPSSRPGPTSTSPRSRPATCWPRRTSWPSGGSTPPPSSSPAAPRPAEDAASCALLGAVVPEVRASWRWPSALSPPRSALDDSLVDAHNTLASVYAAAGRYDVALESFDRALALAPDHVDTHFNRGARPASPQTVPPTAEASFREVLALREEHDSARAKLALALARQGRGKEAASLVKPFEKRRTLVGLHPAGHGGGLLPRRRRRRRRSRTSSWPRREASTSRRWRPSSRRVRSSRARSGWATSSTRRRRTTAPGSSRRLASCSSARARRSPGSPGWSTGWAAWPREEGKDEEARAHFRKSLELDPDFYYSQYELGRLAYRDEDFAAAAALLGEYVEHEEAGANSHYMLGRSHFGLGNHAGGREAPAIGHPQALRLRERLLLPGSRLPRAGPRRGGPQGAPAGRRLAIAPGPAPGGRPPPSRPPRRGRRRPGRGRATTPAVALRLGATDAADARVRSPGLSTGGIELLEITPSLARVPAPGPGGPDRGEGALRPPGRGPRGDLPGRAGRGGHRPRADPAHRRGGEGARGGQPGHVGRHPRRTARTSRSSWPCMPRVRPARTRWSGFATLLE